MVRLAILLMLFTFSIPVAGQEYHVNLKLSKLKFQSDEKFNIKYQAEKPLPATSWIGIFRSGVAQGSHSNYETYQYIDQANAGNYTFTAPAKPGTYDFRVFAAENGKQVFKISFDVVAVDPDKISIKLDAEEYKEGANLNVAFDASVSLNPKAWIGLFDAKTTKEDYSGYKAYHYIKEAKSYVFKVPEKPGNYEIRLYTSDNGEFVKGKTFRVGALDLSAVEINLKKEVFDPEENIEVNFIAHPDLPKNAWIGIFNASVNKGSYTGYMSYHYINKQSSGKMYFKAPVVKGDYEVRMFFSDHGRMLKFTPFNVSSSLDQTYLKQEIGSKGRVRLYGIYFDTDKSVVKTASFPLLSEIADLLNGEKDLKLLIEGHTDNQGDPNYNQNLSLKRAMAVKTLLIEKYNVPATRLEVKGYGEVKPVDDNQTSQGRANNRRVELVKL